MSKYIYNKKLEKVIKDLKDLTKRDCYQIFCVEGEPEILDDKIGGKPYLPIDEEYPVDSNGNPMELLLQLNLKNVKLKDFPKNGILEIFVSVPLEYSPSESLVRVFDEGLEYQTEFPELDHIDFDQRINQDEFKIIVEPAKEYIPVGHYKLGEMLAESLNKYFGTDLTGDFNDLEEFFNNGEYYEIIDGQEEDFFWSIAIPDMISQDETITPTTVGGYAEFIQEDIREYEHEDKDVCIFKMKYLISQDRTIQTEDNAYINVLISRDDLKNNNFSNVIVAWDFE